MTSKTSVEKLSSIKIVLIILVTDDMCVKLKPEPSKPVETSKRVWYEGLVFLRMKMRALRVATSFLGEAELMIFYTF